MEFEHLQDEPIILPKLWNHRLLRRISQFRQDTLDKCASCDWSGDPASVFLGDQKVLFARDLSKIQVTARTGCVRCMILLRLLEKLFRPSHFSEDHQSLAFINLERLEIGAGTLHVYPERDRRVYQALSLFTQIGKGPNLAGIQSRQKLGDTSSTASIEFILAQLANCKAKHVLCNQVDVEDIRPARLLEIISVSYPEKLVLRESASLREPVRYVALSHCWGENPIYTTTRSNIDRHRENIAWEYLSKTFRDAILVTHKLGVKYLWIDSLCIIQKDAGDWELEAGKMLHIYRNSYLTLAALLSSESAGGLFSTPDRRAQFEVAKLSLNGQVQTLFCRRPPFDFPQIHCYSGYPIKAHVDRDQQPLLKRAWVLQERLCAPRVVFFGREELLWECYDSVSCQCSDEVTMLLPQPRSHTIRGRISLLYDSLTTRHHAANHLEFLYTAAGARRPPDLVEWSPKSNFARVLVSQLPPRALNKYEMPPLGSISTSKLAYEARELPMRWRGLIAQYTALALTIQTDRLVAIGGIAELFSKMRPGEDYVCGIWSGSVTSDLMWYVARQLYPNGGTSKHREEGRTAFHPYVAPSWSWASTMTSIQNVFDDDVVDRMDLTPLAQLTMKNNHDGGSPYTLVGSASLRVSGDVGQAIIIQDDPDAAAHPSKPQAGSKHTTWTLSVIREAHISPTRLHGQGYLDFDVFDHQTCHYMQVRPERNGKRRVAVTLLLIAQFEDTYNNKEGVSVLRRPVEAIYLLLMPLLPSAGEGAEGSYRRVGIFRHNFSMIPGQDMPLSFRGERDAFSETSTRLDVTVL